jgi:hypothetical protein
MLLLYIIIINIIVIIIIYHYYRHHDLHCHCQRHHHHLDIIVIIVIIVISSMISSSLVPWSRLVYEQEAYKTFERRSLVRSVVATRRTSKAGIRTQRAVVDVSLAVLIHVSRIATVAGVRVVAFDAGAYRQRVNVESCDFHSNQIAFEG